MNEDQIIQKMAQAMAEAVRDPQWHHYIKPARAAFWIAKEHLAPPSDNEQARASS